MKKIFTIFGLLALIGWSGVLNAQIPTTGLVAKYSFTGNANDESGNSNNGTVNGAALTTDRFGIANSAYSFNGVNNYIDCGNGSSLQLANDITTCLWVKSNNLVLNTPLSKYTTPTGPGWENTLHADGTTSFGGRAPSSYSTSNHSAINVLDGNWHFLVGQREGSVWKIFVDGVLSNQNTASSGNIANSLNLTIGCASQLNYFYSGLIDDVRIFNRALSQTEISALYNENLCYQTITVTDTLIINANLTGFNPIVFQNTIKVFPNPTNDHITIDFGNNYSTMNGYMLKITNSLSQIVYTTPINTQSTTVDLSTWTGNGIYFVHLIDAQSNTIDIRKIVLQ